jgi:hypothetical protein
VLQGGEKGRLGDGLVAGLASSLFDCINASQDRDVTVVGLISPVTEIILTELFDMH